jgi:23S rRNA pseudouridine1911/1915/1917 synthase
MPKEFKFQISAVDQGIRLDNLSAARPELNITRSQTQKLITSGYILVNQRRAKPSYKLKINDLISISIPEAKTIDAKPENIQLDIVYEDKDIVVINKPRGMVVHPAAGNFSGTIVNALLYHCKDLSGIGGSLRPGIVHRLDKDTSGLMVVAKNDVSHQALVKQFNARKILKQYLAIVHGKVKPAQGVIDLAIGRHPVDRKKMSTRAKKSRQAITEYKVLKQFKQHALVELTLKTGRTHQIRVHLHALGRPIVGDPVYGAKKDEFGCKGQLLHSAKLGFIHPTTSQYMEFKSELPVDMQQVINKLSA